VIPPEGCAAILWRDAGRKVEAAEALKLTAPDLLARGIIDEIVPEPVGGAHTNPTAAATLLDAALARALNEVGGLAPAERVEARYQKFRGMGRLGEDFAEETQGSALSRRSGSARRPIPRMSIGCRGRSGSSRSSRASSRCAA